MGHGGGVERGVLTGIAGLRWAAWIWMTIVALVDLHRVDNRPLAVVAVILAGGITATAHVAVRSTEWRRALGLRMVGLELGVATGLVLADGWVRQGRITGQSLSGTWPLAAILVTGVAGGPWWGAAAGGLVSGARAVAVTVAGVPAGQAGRTAVATVSTGASWIVIGAVCGFIVVLLRRTQRELAEAEVRERMARDLHDGVLQTLAIIERRAPTPELARLARDQERELRSYLFGDHRRPGSLAAELRRAAARVEASWPDTEVTITVTEDLPGLTGEQTEAVAGAVTEALTNGAKHGAARRIVVFADIDEATGGLFLSVKDDGRGFDQALVGPGAGMTESMTARVSAVGGTVEVASRPGDGAEVRIALPPPGARRG